MNEVETAEAEPEPFENAGERLPDRTILSRALTGTDGWFLADRAAGSGRPLVCVTRDAQRSDVLARLARFFRPGLEILALPAWDCLPYDRVSPSNEVTAERLRTLMRLAGRDKGRPLLLLVTANAFIQKLPSVETIVAAHFRIRAGGRTERDELSAYLERNGYRRVSTVVDAGEYAVRGGLLDIFPPGERRPVRLDFFGSTLESIRGFDPASQRTSDRIDDVDLRPVSEVVLDADAIERFRAGYLRTFGAVTDDPLLESVTAGRNFPGMEHWLPLFQERLATIEDYVGEDCDLVHDHLAVEALEARAALIGEHYEARMTPEVSTRGFGAAPYHPLEPHSLYLDEQQLRRLFPTAERFQLSPYDTPDAASARVRDLGGRRGRDFARERNDRSINLFDAVVEHIRDLLARDRSPILATSSAGSADRLAQVLQDHGLDAPRMIDSLAEHVDGTVAIAVLPVEESLDAPGLTILGESDLLGERLARAATRRRRADKFIQDVGTLAEGDLVVHAEHGIGLFEGLVTLEIGGAPHDCLKLVYAGGDKLFVPVESIDILSRYGASEGAGQLDKLGGVGWQTRKAKVRQRIREMAEELIRIAAERALREGEALQLPPGMYEEFAARFPFEETEDQLNAIEAVLSDLSSGRPMDRLVCGDVGF
ncbi:MAG: transcription-repair coupling factor, partial [Geminicoccaceae bacterium]|nr:transcription-repair coupling factor [Geminicoccaceae bacterium]